MPLTASTGLPTINMSTRQVITLLLRGGPLHRAELARRLSLTPAAVTKLTKPMIETGLFHQVEHQDKGSTGRPVQPLAINPAWAAFIGVKLTGDRAFAVLTDLAGVVQDTQEALLQGKTVSEVCRIIVHLVKYWSEDRQRRPVGLGVSLAGTVIRSRGWVAASPFLGWADVELATELEPLVGMPVVVENDLRALTIAQHWSNDARRSFTLVTFGAGIGCGLVLDDRLIAGGHGVAGLIDHLPIDDAGPMCARGHRGCLSGYATTEAIVHAMVPASQDAPPLELAEVGAMARDGHPLALKVLQRAGFALGVAIGTICNIAGPDQVILSGEGAELYDALEESLRQGISKVIHPALPPTPISAVRLSFADWARGSAVVAIQQHLDLRSGHF